VRKARQERGEEGRKHVLRGRGGMGRSPMAGAMGGGRGGDRGLRGGSGERGRLSLVDLLPGELNFAAPVEDSLLLHRARDAVLFGRSGSDVVGPCRSTARPTWAMASRLRSATTTAS
jgi:hypothetical protein